MADETKVEGTGGLSLEAMQTMLQQALQQQMSGIGDQVKDAVKAVVADEAATVKRERTAQDAAKGAEADPVLGVVGPYIAPVAMEARGAVDAAVFYPSHPQALKYATEIEQTHSAWATRGIHTTRAEIWTYVQGLHRQDIGKAEQEEAEAATKRAALAGSVGMGSSDRQAQERDPYSMTLEELEKALDGVIL